MVNVCLAKKNRLHITAQNRFFGQVFWMTDSTYKRPPKTPECPTIPARSRESAPEGPNQPHPGPQCAPRSPGVPQSRAMAVSEKHH